MIERAQDLVPMPNYRYRAGADFAAVHLGHIIRQRRFHNRAHHYHTRTNNAEI